MTFLLIENRIKNKPSINLLSTLGASGSRGRYESIGMFGTGTLNAIAILVRKHLWEGSKICLGTDVYTIIPKAEETQDARGNINHIVRIYLKKQNGGLIDLNITAAYGIDNWHTVDMALREFISNAIDGQIDYDGKIQNVKVEVTESDRASKDCVRVYIPMNAEVAEYMDNIKNNFICTRFTYNPKQVVLPKNEPGPSRFYRKGVFAGEFGENALFDYNLPDLKIDECRIVDSDVARRSAARAIMLNKNMLVRYFKAAPDCWERKDISTYYFSPQNYSYDDECAKIRENFEQALTSVLGVNKVVCQNKNEADVLRAKGYEPEIIEDSYLYEGIKQKTTLKKISDVLSKNEREGRMIVDTLPEHIRSFDEVWDMLVSMNLTANKKKPSLTSYRRVEMHDGRDAFAMYDFTNKEVLINADYTSGTNLIQSLLHELGHHITEALDGSLPMQEFGFNVAARLYEKICAKDS